jgi:hypothetical protein
MARRWLGAEKGHSRPLGGPPRSRGGGNGGRRAARAACWGWRNLIAEEARRGTGWGEKGTKKRAERERERKHRRGNFHIGAAGMGRRRRRGGAERTFTGFWRPGGGVPAGPNLGR